MRVHSFLIILFFGAGCAASPVKVSGPAEPLPPLPQDDGLAVARLSSADHQVLLDGASFAAAHPSLDYGTGELSISAGSDELVWAIYQVPGITADYRPQLIETSVHSVNGRYWLALANYQLNRWVILADSFDDDVAANVTGNWQQWASPGGNFYFALIAWECSLVLEYCKITIDDTSPLPAPTELEAQVEGRNVVLNWQPYQDLRAEVIRSYRAEDSGMAGAELVGSTSIEQSTMTVANNIPGKRYYFAITAYESDDELESSYSNIAEVLIPGGNGVLEGQWPRYGGRQDGGGWTALEGPANLDTYESVKLDQNAEVEENHTSPVIDKDGNVYALTRAGQLKSYTSALDEPRFQFSAADWLNDGKEYVCPPHAPCIDSNGNVYFVAVEKDASEGQGWLMCVDSAGEGVWEYDLGTCADVNDHSYCSPNITGAGLVVTVAQEGFVLVSVDSSGEDGWTFDSHGGLEMFTDPLISERGLIEMPVFHSGPGIEDRTRWIAIQASDGNEKARHVTFGARMNYYGGVSLGGDYHVYPEGRYLILIESLSGEWVNEAGSLGLPGWLYSSPACDSSAQHILQLAKHGELPDHSRLCWIKVQQTEPPDLTLVASIEVDDDEMTPSPVSAKPSIDSSHNIYFPTDTGMLYLVHFDPGLEPGPENPKVVDKQQYNRSDTYCFSSFAIGDGVAYIITEQEVLYRVGARPSTK